MAKTIQSGIKKYDDSDARKYAMFTGGVNTTHKALEHLDPLKAGFMRLFIVQMPVFMEYVYPTETKNFKHMLEYNMTSFQGIGNDTMGFEGLQGGINGAQFELPTILTDDTQEVTIGLYEASGSPVREYVSSWMNGISDKLTGAGHYQGALEQTEFALKYAQAYHTMEAIVVFTDPTWRADGIEYVALLTNMVPKVCRKDQFNFETGQVNSVKYEVSFTCTKYESADINLRGRELMEKYRIKQNYVDMLSGYTSQSIADMPAYELVNQGVS